MPQVDPVRRVVAAVAELDRRQHANVGPERAPAHRQDLRGGQRLLERLLPAIDRGELHAE
jgi:hypothetical protein